VLTSRSVRTDLVSLAKQPLLTSAVPSLCHKRFTNEKFSVTGTAVQRTLMFNTRTLIDLVLHGDWYAAYNSSVTIPDCGNMRQVIRGPGCTRKELFYVL
jgi:hypothetical protein